MIKLELSGPIKEEHLRYYKATILPQLANLHVSGEDLKEEYDKFCNFCKEKNNTRRIAVGTPQDLKDIIQEVSVQFPLMTNELDKKSDKKEETLNKKKDKEESGFSKALQKKFGYSEFITIPKFEDYVKNRAKELIFLNEGKKETRYSKCLSKYAHQAINEIFTEHVYSKEDDLGTTKDLTSFLKTMNFTITLENYPKLNQDLLPWSAYKLALLNNVVVCPYCNRQYITPVFSDNGKVRCEFDHFYPKSKYPYLSMSLYNLIPSCSVCNSSLKGQKEFATEDIHPYEDSYNDFFDFVINPIDIVQPKVEVIVQKEKEKTDKFLKMFQIEALYNYHSNQGIEMFEKSIIYPDSYLDELMNFGREKAEEGDGGTKCKLDNIGKMFDSKEELKALIYGYIIDEKEIGNEAFGKLRRDVAKQLGLIP